MICNFEGTFCAEFVDLFKGFCPYCGGGFEKRPVRLKNLIAKCPPSYDEVYNPVDILKYLEKLLRS